MTQILINISVSLDGFVAGPNQTLEEPLGENGMRLHEWVLRLASWREQHGLEGGEHGPEDELHARDAARAGAVVMGRRMFSGGSGPWEDDPNADAWWGDDPPFRMPVFVVTHHARRPETKPNGTTYTFVTDGVEAAVEQARAAAGGKDVLVAGGADVVQQCLRAGLVDEVHLHVAPLLLGGGVRLFGELDEPLQLEPTEVLESPLATHVRYRVARADVREA